jgi:site-specific DNA-methyltransferase (adenine-specific)
MNTLYYDDNLSIMAELMAFKDIWTWDTAAQATYDELQNVPNVPLVNFVNALHGGLERTPILVYPVNMAVRLVEIHRVLKVTGPVYLHCDPTASHYLRMIMDAVFSATNFRSEYCMAANEFS